MATGTFTCNGANSTPLVRKRSYEVVIAATRDMGLGMDMKLPWDLPTDTKFFHDVTTKTMDPGKKNATIMGRKSWEATPLEIRPLPGRLNIILTKSGSLSIATDESVLICSSMESALELLAAPPYCLSIEKVFVIGGGELLRNYMNAPSCDAIHLTEIDISVQCDAFAPRVDTALYRPWYSSSPIVENGIRYSFNTYVRIKDPSVESDEQKHGLNSNCGSENVEFEAKQFSFLPKMVFKRHEEFQYLNLVRDIVSSGDMKDSRMGTGTSSKFGCQMRFNLRKTFPLLTTKKVFWQGVIEKLLWSMSGSTNAKSPSQPELQKISKNMVKNEVLQEKNIHIWDGKASGESLDSVRSVDREDGDLGPVYGFQWRHFGARYIDMHADYTGQGFDQLSDVMNKIKNNPNDRRIILTAWNPTDLNLMALPPCPVSAQFYVANGELSCQICQLSAEMALDVPFNIASFALLTCMIAHISDLLPGDFIHVTGDAHVYSTGVVALQRQLQKSPKPFPILKINPEKKNIDSFVVSDFELLGYEPHRKMEMKMVV